MNALAALWLEDEEPRDLARWGIAAAIVLGAHAALIAGYLVWQRLAPADMGVDAPVVNVDFDPNDVVPDATQRDVAPAQEEMIEQKPVPEAEKQPDQPKEQPPPPPDSTAIPEPEAKPPEKVVEQPKPPAPRTAARVIGGAPRVEPTWASGLVKHLQQYKRYPTDAQSKSEEGTVILGFSVDRTGHVLSRHIVRSSGHADLDEEVMSLVDRAQPLPPFPPTMTQAQLELTVPIRFSLH
jgi:protein TonB